MSLSLQILSYSSDLDTSQVMLTAIILKAVLLPRGYSCLHPRIWQSCLRECPRVHRRMCWNSMEGCPQEDLSNERETTPYLSPSFVQPVRINVITITWEGLANPFLLIIHLNEITLLMSQNCMWLYTSIGEREEMGKMWTKIRMRLMVFLLLSNSVLEDSAKIGRLWTYSLHCWGTT